MTSLRRFPRDWDSRPFYEFRNTLERQQQRLPDDGEDGELEHRESALTVGLIGRHCETGGLIGYESGNGSVSWQAGLRARDGHLGDRLIRSWEHLSDVVRIVDCSVHYQLDGIETQ